MTDNDDMRPSPEAMLKLAQAEEVTAELGKLKIFLGYAAGVGKTYAMLEAARQRRKDGRDVLVGYVESHGRSETDVLLDGLEVLPRRELYYSGVVLPEMDLDAILARRPQIVLVDELAHSNAPGSRHEKRWQDVEEILEAGIDVYTTVNIQHFESLNDVVAQITGVTVRETVPDRLLDLAFEIKLIDISPEDLLQRLREGKVYIPDQAAKAMDKFFRLGIPCGWQSDSHMHRRIRSALVSVALALADVRPARAAVALGGRVHGEDARRARERDRDERGRDAGGGSRARRVRHVVQRRPALEPLQRHAGPPAVP